MGSPALCVRPTMTQTKTAISTRRWRPRRYGPRRSGANTTAAPWYALTGCTEQRCRRTPTGTRRLASGAPIIEFQVLAPIAVIGMRVFYLKLRFVANRVARQQGCVKDVGAGLRPLLWPTRSPVIRILAGGFAAGWAIAKPRCGSRTRGSRRSAVVTKTCLA